MKKKDWEAIEIADWVYDIKRAKYKKSEKYLKAIKLADKFKKKRPK